MAEHVPGPISTTVVGVQAPPTDEEHAGEYLQCTVALTRCSCGLMHAGISDETSADYGRAAFWLGVKFAQLNKWTELELPDMRPEL